MRRVPQAIRPTSLSGSPANSDSPRASIDERVQRIWETICLRTSAKMELDSISPLILVRHWPSHTRTTVFRGDSRATLQWTGTGQSISLAFTNQWRGEIQDSSPLMPASGPLGANAQYGGHTPVLATAEARRYGRFDQSHGSFAVIKVAS